MNSKPETNKEALLVYPTAVALRQAQRRALERDAFFDGRGHITLSSLLRECAGGALKSRKLRPISDLDRELAIVEAVSKFRKMKPSPQPSPPKGEGVRSLAPTALEEALAQLIDTVAPLADRADDFLKLIGADRTVPKNPELASLYAAYTGVCRSLGIADDATLNAAILALLRGDRAQWPSVLRQARTITFLAVRWVAPFQESVIHALASQLGRDHVVVRHILSDYEQDWWGGNLLTDTGRLLFGDASTVAAECEFQSAATRSAIEHLTSLREGYAMQDRALAEQARSRVGFSCSVGVYGEVEDLARRIAWELHDRPDPVRPEDICLVSRSLGTAADAIMDVFARFNIPYYFRRGTPVLAVPVIKTLLNFARFSATRDRDTFCALLQSPWVDWTSSGFDPVQLADDLLRSGVEPVMDDPERIGRRLVTYTLKERRFDNRAEAESYSAKILAALQSAAGLAHITTYDTGLANLLTRCKMFKVGVAPDPDPGNKAAVQAHLLNAKAWETVSELLETLRRHALLNRSDNGATTWEDITDLLNRALENVTVSAAPPDESGVWILNPFDIAGLSFKVVLVAGLNAGAFPKSPAPSPLFSDAELLAFRDRLQKKGPLPVAALAASRARNSQENLLFLTTLAASRDRMVFSFAGHDETGQPLTPSVFFSTLWRLVGWPAWDALPDLPPDPYDQWRLTCATSHFERHWTRHREMRKTEPVIPAYKRHPFPGESYLGTVPLELCRADDERRQRLAEKGEHQTSNIPHSTFNVEKSSTMISERSAFDVESSMFNVHCSSSFRLAEHIAHGIKVERQRQAFFSRQKQETRETPPDLSGEHGHEFAGVLDPALWSRVRPTTPDGIPDFSPTQLERLVACPYQYYLQYILKMEPIEPNDLEPSIMDIGTAIHAIMNTGFRMAQGLEPDFPIPALGPLTKTSRRLFKPAWAVRNTKGLWHYQHTLDRPSDDALPLVDFPADDKAVLSFFDQLTETMLDWATSGNAVWMLGAPEQMNVQRRRIGRAIRNLVRTAVAPESLPEITDGDSAIRRYPALLEYTFNSRNQDADAPSLELTDPANPARKLRLHGKIDRVDLIFDENHDLRAAVIIDYKGSGKADLKSQDLAEGISTAADCQLPVYAMAATRALRQSALSNPESQIPIILHYLSYTLSGEDMIKQSTKQWISLDGKPQGERDLAAEFTASAFAALSRYERGDFAVAPEACDFCQLKACCRHAANLLSSDSQNGGGES